MKIDVCSDLHCDFYNNDIIWKNIKTPEADTLLVAGDCANSTNVTNRVLSNAASCYKNVLYVDGNHDFYQTVSNKLKIDDVKETYKVLSEQNGWTYISNSSFIVKDTVFLGANGWYDWNLDIGYSKMVQYDTWKRGMNDARCINFIGQTPEFLAEQDFIFFTNYIKSFDKNDSIKNIVCMTHTIPNKSFIEKRNDFGWDSLSGSFCNTKLNGDHQLSLKLKLWLFGHTHFCFDKLIDHTRFVCNPRGYPYENPRWKMVMVEI